MSAPPRGTGTAPGPPHLRIPCCWPDRPETCRRRDARVHGCPRRGRGRAGACCRAAAQRNGYAPPPIASAGNWRPPGSGGGQAGLGGREARVVAEAGAGVRDRTAPDYSKCIHSPGWG